MQSIENLNKNKSIKDGDERSCSWRLDRSIPIPSQLHFIPSSLLESLWSECEDAPTEEDFHAVIDRYCNIHNWPKGCLVGHQKRGKISCLEMCCMRMRCEVHSKRSIYVNILLLKPCFDDSRGSELGTANRP